MFWIKVVLIVYTICRDSLKSFYWLNIISTESKCTFYDFKFFKARFERRLLLFRILLFKLGFILKVLKGHIYMNYIIYFLLGLS